MVILWTAVYMKGVGIIGNYRGKLGNSVAYTIKGSNNKETQGFRIYQPNVKNPRTLPQQIQRMLIASAGTAYSAGKSILDHSFEGISAGVSSMNHFRRIAYQAYKSAAEGLKSTTTAFTPYGLGYSAPIAVQISSGTLSSLNYDPSGTNFSAVTMPLSVAGNIIDLGDGTSVADILKQVPIPVGGYLTYIAWLEDSDNGRFNWTWLRVYHPGEDKLNNPVDNVADFNDLFKVQVRSTSNSNLNVVATSVGEGTGLTLVLEGGEGIIAATAVIASMPDGRRSTEYMRVREDWTPSYNYAKALATYPVGEGEILNGTTSKGITL